MNVGQTFLSAMNLRQTRMSAPRVLSASFYQGRPFGPWTGPHSTGYNSSSIGAWEAWMEFFLTGVRDTATQAVETARELIALFDRDREAIQTLGRSAASIVF